jgi:hypothetical protein
MAEIRRSPYDEEGAAAYLRGETRESCIYENGSEAWAQWRFGWMKAKAQAEQAAGLDQ